MKIEIVKGNPVEFNTDLLVVGAYEGDKKLRDSGAEVDKALGGIVSELLKDHGFEGKKHETLTIQTHGKIGPKKVLVIGLGKTKDVDAIALREVAAAVAKKARAERAKHITFGSANTKGRSTKALREAAAMIAEGVLLGTYHFGHYYGKERKDQHEKHALEKVSLLGERATDRKAIEAGVTEGQLRAEATMMTRDLVNTPSADMTPKHMVDVARNIAKQSKRISLEVFDRVQAKKLGMGAFLGVAQGSDQPPYFIHLTYKPKQKKAKKVFLCGKGITFDTGGISLKPAAALEQWPMLVDMAGGAVLLGLFSKIDALAPKAEVHALIPATENMPSGKALKPHDIVTAMNGKTIEVVNTDAEGRLILSDALSFAVEHKADVIVDLATLTGAAVVALGTDIAALFANNKKLGKQVKDAATAVGENMWEMPLPPQYRKGIDSPSADIKNIGPRYDADVITAALFLKEFVGDIPWVHLDIAGPAWVDAPRVPSVSARGTGFGVRTLIEFLESIS